MLWYSCGAAPLVTSSTIAVTAPMGSRFVPSSVSSSMLYVTPWNVTSHAYPYAMALASVDRVTVT